LQYGVLYAEEEIGFRGIKVRKEISTHPIRQN